MQNFFDNDELSVSYDYTGADTSIFSFTGVGLGLGGVTTKDIQQEEFRKSLSLMPCNGVFVVDKNRSWYSNTYIDDVLNKFMQDVHTKWNVKRVVTIGNSMGGTGAIKFGDLLNAYTSIAFCPQSSVAPSCVPFENRYDTYVQVNLGKFDLIDVADKKYVLNALPLFGMDEPVDMLHAERFYRAGILPLVIANSNHDLAANLKKWGFLSEILRRGTMDCKESVWEFCIEHLDCVPFDRLSEFFELHTAYQRELDLSYSSNKIDMLREILNIVPASKKLQKEYEKLSPKREPSLVENGGEFDYGTSAKSFFQRAWRKFFCFSRKLG